MPHSDELNIVLDDQAGAIPLEERTIHKTYKWLIEIVAPAMARYQAEHPDEDVATAYMFSFQEALKRLATRVDGQAAIETSDKNYYRMQFSEIEVWVRPPSGDQNSLFNQAVGATVTASSSFEGLGWSTEKANDGFVASEPGTLGWSSDSGLTADHVEWIALNLGATYPIYRVVLYPRSDGSAVGQGFPVDFEIQASSDITCSADWATILSRINYPKPGDAGQVFALAAPGVRPATATP